MRFPPLIFEFVRFFARRIFPLDRRARSGCARFQALTRRIRLSGELQ
jgi:hypothetical protein